MNSAPAPAPAPASQPASQQQQQQQQQQRRRPEQQPEQQSKLSYQSLPIILHDSFLLVLAVPHRASQIARCASQLRIAESKSQQKCHAVSNASHASLLASPHRRDFSKSSSHRKEKWSQKTFKFHRNLKNSCKNEDKNRFGKILRREVVFQRSL